LEKFEKLFENPSILKENSLAQIFYSNCLGTDIECVVKTRKFLRESQFEPNITPLLELKFDERSLRLNELHQLHVLLQQNYQESTVLLIQQKNAELILLNSDIVQLETILQSHKSSKLELADLYNNNIQGTVNSFVMYEKFINRLAIQNDSNTLFNLSFSDHTTVLYIAGLCPKIYGNSVYLARTFLNSSEILSLENSCSSANILNSNSDSKFITLSLSTTIVDIEIEGVIFSDIKQIELVNSSGVNQVAEIVNNRINLEGMPSGLYYLVLRNKNGRVEYRKFVKL